MIEIIDRFNFMGIKTATEWSKLQAAASVRIDHRFSRESGNGHDGRRSVRFRLDWSGFSREAV